jgi:hypothetical protein
LIRAERNDGVVILRVTEERSFLFADADDTEVDPGDLDRLVQRIDIAEETIGESPAKHRDLLAALDFHLAHHASRFDAEGGEVAVGTRDALDLRVVDLLGPVRHVRVLIRLSGD